MEKCTNEHFKKISPKDFNDSSLNNSLCLPLNKTAYLISNNS